MPVLLGLAPLLSSVFGAIFAFLSTYYAKKLASGLTIAAILLTVTLTFYVAVKLLVIGIASTIPNDYLLMYFYVLWPSNAETSFSAMFAVEIGAFLYRHQLTIIRAVASA